MSGESINRAERKPYEPPEQLFGAEGIFPEFTGREEGKFGAYDGTFDDAVGVCGEHWVPLLLTMDHETGVQFLRSYLVEDSGSNDGDA